MNVDNTETKAVVDAGAVPPLVHMLSSRDDKVVEVGLWALANIIGDGERLRDFVLSQGFLETYLNIFKREIPNYLQKNPSVDTLQSFSLQQPSPTISRCSKRTPSG